MKNILFLLAIVSLVLTSCQPDELLPPPPPTPPTVPMDSLRLVDISIIDENGDTIISHYTNKNTMDALSIFEDSTENSVFTRSSSTAGSTNLIMLAISHTRASANEPIQMNQLFQTEAITGLWGGALVRGYSGNNLVTCQFFYDNKKWTITENGEIGEHTITENLGTVTNFTMGYDYAGNLSGIITRIKNYTVYKASGWMRAKFNTGGSATKEYTVVYHKFPIFVEN